MFRPMLSFAVAIVLVLGCGKKKDEGSGGGDPNAPAPGVTPSDPNAAYTIKIRVEQAGDKTEIDITETGTAEITFGGKGGAEKQDRKLEYTEHIIDMPTGSTRPTKLTRTYKVAQQFDKGSGAKKAMPYEGKTITIEKRGAIYDFTVDGKKLSPIDTFELSREFTKPDNMKTEDFLPKAAVKVGESWDAGAALKGLSGVLPFPLDASKSKITGKLTRAYTKDGKQWGAIALDLDLTVDSGAGPKGSASGTIKMTLTFDVPIDGSSREGTMTRVTKMNVTGTDGGGETKIVADGVETNTVKPAKKPTRRADARGRSPNTHAEDHPCFARSAVPVLLASSRFNCARPTTRSN